MYPGFKQRQNTRLIRAYKNVAPQRTAFTVHELDHVIPGLNYWTHLSQVQTHVFLGLFLKHNHRTSI